MAHSSRRRSTVRTAHSPGCSNRCSSRRSRSSPRNHRSHHIRRHNRNKPARSSRRNPPDPNSPIPDRKRSSPADNRTPADVAIVCDSRPARTEHSPSKHPAPARARQQARNTQRRDGATSNGPPSSAPPQRPTASQQDRPDRRQCASDPREKLFGKARHTVSVYRRIVVYSHRRVRRRASSQNRAIVSNSEPLAPLAQDLAEGSDMAAQK